MCLAVRRFMHFRIRWFCSNMWRRNKKRLRACLVRLFCCTFLLRFIFSILALSSFILLIVMEFSSVCCSEDALSVSSSSSAYTLCTEVPLKHMHGWTLWYLLKCCSFSLCYTELMAFCIFKFNEYSLMKHLSAEKAQGFMIRFYLTRMVCG